MTREEILSKAKPILFNTEMVKAILDGRKSVTRRAVKMKYGNTHIELRNNKYGSSVIEKQNDVEGETFGKRPDGTSWQKVLAVLEVNPPFKIGDYLYVRETWAKGCIVGNRTSHYVSQGEMSDIIFKEECIHNNICTDGVIWKPSIHMPKWAARIFLRVTDVKVERLQNITITGLQEEGILNDGYVSQYAAMTTTAFEDFKELWNSTVKKSGLDKYGWDANPWVWVIEFERVNTE